jgi:glycosyltransferase involved in cell wall biosynthesis
LRELGQLSRHAVAEVLGQARVGLAVLLPVPKFVGGALPVKLFEYMAAGIPSVVSDFQLWREIVEGADCGICVDPTDPAAVAAAINRLLDDPEEAERMGRNGRRSVEQRYNWQSERVKLLDLYADAVAGG